jgi:hypothetical protein
VRTRRATTQILELKTTGPDGQPLWAYRYRLDGRGSRRIQRGGYASADDARDALQRALAAAQRRKGRARMTLAALAEEYLAQHDGQPETTAKLRWLLTKSTAAFGPTPLTELDAREIAAWRMTLPTGHRFEATRPPADPRARRRVGRRSLVDSGLRHAGDGLRTRRLSSVRLGNRDGPSQHGSTIVPSRPARSRGLTR